MKLFLVKYRKRVEYEDIDLTFYVVAAESGWEAIRLVDVKYNVGTSNLNVSEEIPKLNLDNIKESEILLTYW